MRAFLKEFEVGGPQFIAAGLLLALFLQSLAMALRTPLSRQEKTFLSNGSRQTISDSLLVFDVVALVSKISLLRDRADLRVSSSEPGAVNLVPLYALRLPFVIFGVWLGGALWWVARRLFGNPGGYVALLLFCFSPQVIVMSSRINPEVIAAWGFFGVVYTAIGVAHTLDAPPRGWPPRIVLLGLAFGFAAASHLLAAAAGVLFAIAFMMYLAPGHRRAVAGIIVISLVMAAVFVWACYGFSADMWSSLGRGIWKWRGAHPQFLLQAGATASWFSVISNLILLVLEMASLITILLWNRARYFGNSAPWMVFATLGALAWLTGGTSAKPWLWALPFLFVFVGGMSADWLESRGRQPAVLALTGLLLAYALASILDVASY